MTYNPQNPNGQTTKANSSPVVIASDQNVLVIAGTIATSSTVLASGASTSALQTTGNSSLSSIDTKTPSLGQALVGASVPVVLPAAQITTLTPLSSVTVTQGTGTNLHTVVDSGTISTVTNVVHVDDNSTTLSIDDGGGSITVDGAFYQGTQPVSIASTINASLSTIGQTGNALDVNIKSGGAGNGAILDGVDSNIKATVFDYSNSNPLGVVLRDTNGDYVSVGGGTQYTEDAVAAADPVGTAHIVVRADTPAAITSTDGDNVAQRGTNYGAAYVTLLDTAGSPVSVGGGTQYTEDSYSTANPIGTMSMAVSSSSLSAVVTDSDNIALRATSKGELYVKQTDSIPVTDNSGSLTVDNAGTFAVQAAKSGTWIIDANSGVDIGDVTINNSTGGSAVNIQDGGNSITVDGSVTVTQATGSNLHVVVDTAPSTAVTGTFWQSTQPVSIAATVNSSILNASGANAIPIQDGGNTITIDGTLTGITNVVHVDDNSGSITIDQPTGTNLHTVVDSGTITSLTQLNGQNISLNTGTRDAGTQRVTIATNDVVPVSDNSGSLTVDAPVGTPAYVRLSDGAAAITTLPVSVAATLNTSINGGTMPVTQATGTNLHTVVDSGTISTITNVVHVDDNSSTLTVDQPTGSNLHTVVDSGTVTTVSTVTSLTQMNGQNITMNTGTRDAGTQRVTIATNDLVPISDNSGSITVDAPVGTPAYVRLSDGAAAITTLPVSIAAVVNTSINGGTMPVTQATGTNLHTVVDSGTITTITNVVHVDDNASSLTVDYATTGNGTATGAIRVALPTDGTGVVGLNTGTNSIGKISDITASIVPGTAATNLGKAEDAVAGSGDTGLFVLGVRRDGVISTAPASTAGDYSEIAVDNYGQLRTAMQARTTNPTAAADAQGVVSMADKLGRNVVVLNHVRDLVFQGAVTISSTTETSILDKAGASVFTDLTELILTNTSSSQVRADVRDAVAGSVVLSVGLAPSGGAVIPFAVPMKQTTANNAWTVQLSTAVTDVRVFMQAVRNL